MIIFFSGLLGLVVGSFLNVVIARLPVMMQRAWRQECHALLTETQAPVEPVFNLALPRSQCPYCHATIRALDNIPLLSYWYLNGHCRNCSKPIAWSYPAVEVLSAVLTIGITLQFGVSWTALCALGFSWSLLALFFIDFNTQLLPDNITIPLLWAGLSANLFNLFTDLPSAVLGALAGYLSFWFISGVYKLLTQRVGIGNGDFKLLAAIGAWFGYQALPVVIFMASVLGVLMGLIILYKRKQDRHTPIAFGPYLAVAGVITLLGGKICWWLV